MGLPTRTFTESTTWLSLIVAAKVSSANLGSLYNAAYRTLLETHEWSARKAEGVVNTVDPYTTGTATATQASATVTGIGTTWTSAMVGRFIRIGSDDAFYEITAFGSTTSITVEKAYAPTTQTAASYEIFQYKYAVDATAGEVGQLLLPYEGLPIFERDLRWVTRTDPARRQTGTPIAFILHGVDSTGSQLVEFWPRYSAATSVRLPYYKRVDDIASSTKPIIRSDLIEALTLQYAYSRLASEFGDPQYPRERDYWAKVHDRLFETAVKEDQARHNLPLAVQDEPLSGIDWEFYVQHDI